MRNANPIVFGLACALGVFLSNLFTGGGDLLTAALAGGFSGAIVASILYVLRARRG